MMNTQYTQHTHTHTTHSPFRPQPHKREVFTPHLGYPFASPYYRSMLYNYGVLATVRIQRTLPPCTLVKVAPCRVIMSINLSISDPAPITIHLSS